VYKRQQRPRPPLTRLRKKGMNRPLPMPKPLLRPPKKRRQGLRLKRLQQKPLQKRPRLQKRRQRPRPRPKPRQ